MLIPVEPLKGVFFFTISASVYLSISQIPGFRRLRRRLWRVPRTRRLLCAYFNNAGLAFLEGLICFLSQSFGGKMPYGNKGGLFSVGLFFMAFFMVVPALAQSAVGASGLPLPRFVSLRTAEVNLRSGPGVRYPILWVFHRKDWPVEIVDEFDNWRHIRDLRGTRGWVHRSMLQGRRFVVVQGAAAQPLQAEDSLESGVVARLEPGVIAHLDDDCAVQSWCPVSVGSFSGWLPAAVLYGVKTTDQVK